MHQHRFSLTVGLFLLSAASIPNLADNANAQSAHSTTAGEAQFDSRWKGNLSRYPGSVCGPRFLAELEFVVRGRTIEFSLDYLGRKWEFDGDLEPDGSFQIWTPFALYSGFQDSEFDGQLQLKGDVSKHGTGTFQVFMHGGSWDCHGELTIYRVDSSPATTANKNSSAYTKHMADDTLSKAIAEAEAIAAGNAKLNSQDSAQDTPPSKPEPATPRPAPQNQSAIDLAFWNSVAQSDSAEMYRAYLRQFPNGRFATLARLKLKSLEVTPQVAAVTPGRAEKPKANPYAGIQFGKYHALVIGNNKYKRLSRLVTAEHDARVVGRTLRDLYGFNVRVLLNATRNDLITALSGLRRTLTANDNLLIYYAGHGELDTIAEQGYWLPVDADAEIPTNWVSTSDITVMVRAIRAKHIMVVADSCYSGTLVRDAQIEIRNALTERERKAWLQRMTRKRARTALVSGGLEPVLDGGGRGHSVFANAFLGALVENTDVLDGQMLFDRIKRPVVVNSDQTPQYSDIRRAGHDGGDFLFVRRYK